MDAEELCVFVGEWLPELVIVCETVCVPDSDTVCVPEVVKVGEALPE